VLQLALSLLTDPANRPLASGMPQATRLAPESVKRIKSFFWTLKKSSLFF
jgi:hypothetical protein